MEINAQFDQQVSAHVASQEWTPSPMPGVTRKMLDRLGGEVARATSIVSYAPESSFSPHVHTGGEEFLVLEGVFQDEHGDFPVGTYIRNPPESSHTPASAPGCEIFVKLWQFDLGDRLHVNVDTTRLEDYITDPESGRRVLPLYKDDREDVRMEIFDSNSAVTVGDPGGYELLVVEGEFVLDGEIFTKHSWLRMPKGAQNTLKICDAGARVWVKSGHLKVQPTAPAQ